MRRNAYAATAAVMLFVLFGAARNALACSCMGPNPMCAAFWRLPAGAVFAGEVESISKQPRPSSAGRPDFVALVVHFKVTEGFRGVRPGPFVLRTGQGGGDCGYPFVVGESYLVFADGAGSDWTTGVCDPTRPLAESAGDVAYLRSLAGNASPDGRVYGRITSRRENVDRPGLPAIEAYLGGVAFTLSGSAGHFNGSTAADGSFDVAVPPGRYHLDLDVPSGMYAVTTQEIDVAAPHACASADATVLLDGHISGRAVGARGDPLAHLMIDAVPAASAAERWHSAFGHATTGPDGRFDLAHLPPGTYQVGINVSSYSAPAYPADWFSVAPPSRAQTATIASKISIAEGARVDIGNYVVNGTGSFDGIVLDETGHAVAGARVYLWTESAGEMLAEPVTTGADGRFEFAVLAGRRYRFVAEFRDTSSTPPRPYSAELVMTATEARTLVTLTLKKP